MRQAHFGRDKRGVAALEFALVAPPLVLLVFGAIQYGLYLGTANSLQQLTNDAARVALAGLGEKEREALVEAHVHGRGASYGFLVTERIRADVEEGGDVIVVRTEYDASNLPIFALKGLLPMPSSTIEQETAIALGGY